MGSPNQWFPKRLDGQGFKLMLVYPRLEVAFDAFVRFRQGVWADAAKKPDSRVYDAGFQWELDLQTSSWGMVQPDRDEQAGRYLVMPLADTIVGLLRVVQKNNCAVYANVLYRRDQDRHGVLPDVVLRHVLNWLSKTGIQEVATGNVRGPKFDDHVKRCGFSWSSDGWRYAV